jgi:hypothetical protein
MHSRLKVFVAFLTTASCFAGPAYAKNPATSPVMGGAFTTVNEAVDGSGHCKDGNPGVNCNHYASKFHVWMNGGPATNGLRQNGQYFFAVVAPGHQPDPNDGAPGNLSDDYDDYTKRTFTVTNGEVSAYTGPHTYDAARDLIRLWNFADTPNNGGVYHMAICYLGNGYPVKPRSCKYDAFKAPNTDTTPPVCVLSAMGVNAAGAKYIQVTVQDPGHAADGGSGIEGINIDVVMNATLTYSQNPYPVGTFSPIVITATKTDPTKSSFLKLTVTNVAGLSTTCDPEVKPTARKVATKAAALTPTTLLRRGGR